MDTPTTTIRRTSSDPTAPAHRTAPADRAGTHRRRGWALLTVSLGTFMTLLDNNIVNVAIPTMQRHLHLTQSGVEWVVSAYIVAFAGLLLAGGRMADVVGRRRLFVVGLVVFTAASLGAGLAGGVGTLVVARAVQGLGAALLTPTSLAIITELFPEPAEQARAVGLCPPSAPSPSPWARSSAGSCRPTSVGMPSSRSTCLWVS